MKENKKAILLLIFCFCLPLHAGDVNIAPKVSTSVVSSETNVSNSASTDSKIFSINPSIAATFDGNQVRGELSLSHNHLQQNIARQGIGETNSSQSFTDFAYSIESQIVKNVFTLHANGRQAQRNLDSSQELVNDEYLGSESLSKTQNNTVGFKIIAPNPKYFGMSLSADQSQVTSDRQTNLDTKLRSDDTNIQANLFQGRSFNKLGWDITGQHRKTNGSLDNDLISSKLNGIITFTLIENIRVILSGSREQNERGNDNGASRKNLGNDSYGIGLGWFTSGDRYIDVTYNSSSQINGERTNNLGVDLKWRLTRLTNIEASYGRRFFGKSGAFSLSHNNRMMRSSITYSEDITTFSRLILNTGTTGVFVCPIGESSIVACFQPSEPEYQLRLGEEFTNLQLQAPDISEEVLLSRNLNASLGFSRRKINVLLSLKYNDTEYLETSRKQITKSANLSIGYAAGRKTNFKLGLNHALTDREQENLQTKTWSGDLAWNRQLGRQLSSDLAYRFVKSESSASGNSLIDRRVTLSMIFTF